jgi:predicted metal-dependent peptidase
MITDTQVTISASILRLRMKSPFFATLAMFARFIPKAEIATAATDGKDIFYSEEYLRSLSPRQIDGLLLHEVLHAALLHIPRRGNREPERWNIAADIVINGMIAAENTFELPPDCLRNHSLEKFTVEEVYELLPNNQNLQLAHPDLIDSGNLSPAETAAVTAHWRSALQQAKIIAQSAGTIPGGILRELEGLTTPQLDWRSYLWRYLTQTPSDFQDFDRRLIGQGLYLETLGGESVKVSVAIDTSGSIDLDLLRLFLSEVWGILNAYPHLKCDLYYADTELFGPYELDISAPLPKPQGGGGTSFVPFFEAVQNQKSTSSLCIYLTDGYGDFPSLAPAASVLWVVVAGGLESGEFPFGEVVRLDRAV